MADIIQALFMVVLFFLGILRFRKALVKEGFVLDFCPTFRILSFVMSGKNLRSHIKNPLDF